ncbi:MAG: hypothetical protein WD600_09710, partial [Pseudohongiella sp.]
HCQQISDYISLDGDDALVLEVGRSLNYFGSLARIRTRIESGIAAQGIHIDFFQAVTPNASASLLLARTGHNVAFGKPEDLRSRLGGIPTSALAIDIRICKKLAKCGLFYLRDIWRLPLPELRIRFGRHFSDYIEQCLGLRAEMRVPWQARPDYHDRYDAEHGLCSVQQILYACEQLLHRLEAFLKQNHLCTDELVFTMDYASAGEAQNCERVSVNIRKADRAAALFLLLLETRLSDMHFCGEIYAINLRVTQFTDFRPAGGFQHRKQTQKEGVNSQLLDTLAARLGSNAVQRLLIRQDYCPEFSTLMAPYLAPLTEDKADAWHSSLSVSQNPCWLLAPPHPLSIRNQQLHYLSPLTLLRGPRRIETRWWQDEAVRRDYYVAANAQGNLLWIYQDLARKTETERRGTDWYLHGFFG